MASMTQVLEAVNTKEASVSTADLAKELTASVEGTRKQLGRLKDKGYVEGNSQEGWLITDVGRKELEKGEVHPSMIDEEVTPRQQFEAIGRRIIGIKEDTIVLATDIVWSGDYEDIKWVWEALGQANIANDLRRVWANSWRAKLQKGIPPELETELTGAVKAEAEAREDITLRKPGGREYIIVDDEPVRVGTNLGDYSMQDAKDILSIRALRNRFGGAGQQGAAAQSGVAEKVSEVLTALSPYLNKGSDIGTLKEMLADKLEIQRQEILSHIPQQGQASQPKSFMGQITELVGALGSLKEAGPILRSILGIPDPSGNPGNPVSTDLEEKIKWEKFQGDERRADERQTELVKTLKVARENIPDGIQAILATAAELKTGAGARKAPAPEEQPQIFSCGDCKTQFSPPPGWVGQPIKCPNPECGREYSKEELLG